jgi:drug/metabolite transporter superfamily protein YnfA
LHILNIIFAGAGLFLISFAVHILVWRLIRPGKQMLWLTIVFIFLPIFGWVALRVFGAGLSGIGTDWLSGSLILLLTILLSAAYIMSYPPIQAGCPSLKIILAVNDAGPAGLTEECIHRVFSEDILVSERLEDLVNDGLIFVKEAPSGHDLVSLKNDTLVISRQGYLIARMFASYRKILDLPFGKG